MIGDRRVLALIPARGGSRRLPRKNVRYLNGKPLIAWTIEAALAAVTVDRVILSSDNADIISVAKEHGCDVPFVRPHTLATDEASSMDVIWHALDSVGESFDDVVLLQPTSPLRTPADIDGCVRLRVEHDALAVVSVTSLPKPPSHFVAIQKDWRLQTTGVFAGPAGSVALLNGAVYEADIARLRRLGTFYDETTRGWLMPPERSVDVDNAIDFALSEVLLQERARRE